jgi:hypothetical protein
MEHTSLETIPLLIEVFLIFIALPLIRLPGLDSDAGSGRVIPITIEDFTESML